MPLTAEKSSAKPLSEYRTKCGAVLDALIDSIVLLSGGRSSISFLSPSGEQIALSLLGWRDFSWANPLQPAAWVLVAILSGLAMGSIHIW